MPKFEEHPDLLASYAEERARVLRLRRIGLVSASVLLVLGVGLEAALNGTTFGLVAFSWVFAIGAVLILGVGYSGFVFVIANAYARSLRKHGQTRPEPLQVLAILTLDGLATLLLAAFVIRDQLDARFWVAMSVIVWTNIVASMLGYFSEFWHGYPPSKLG